MNGSQSAPPRRIKKEPLDPYSESFATPSYGPESNEDLLPRPGKHAASPAQEATRARISTFQAQLRRLQRLRAAGKLDHRGLFQIRCLEEDLRKAHSKLRRLLNEAERQRRRRERLRSSADASALGMLVFGGGDESLLQGGFQTCLPTIASYCGSSQSPAPETDPPRDDRGIMAALRNCGKFEDFVRELHSLGFTLSRMNSEPQVLDIQEDSENGADEVKVHVELIEGDAVLEHSMSVCEEADVEEIKAEPPTSPSSSESMNDKITADNDSSAKKKKKSNANKLKTFADEYARKHNLYIREWQDQYQDWFERQMESQQQWEETFMREQMELAKSMLESVTTTFLQGMQQVLQNVMGSIARRPMTPFCPTLPRNLDLNGLNHADMSSFMDPQSATNNRAFMPTNSKMDEAADL